MAKLLYIEWLKLKHYRTFWVLAILYLISIFGINYIVFRIQEKIYEANQSKGMAEMIIGSRPYAFPEVWHTTSYFSSFLLFMPGLLMIISVTNEYSFKTHRQNIIDGWSRANFINVKMVQTALLALVSTVVVFITALIFGMMEKEAISFDKFNYLGRFFLQAFSYTMVALLFSVLFRRGGLAIGIFFLYSVVLENLLAGLMNRYMNYSGRYLPLESTDNLIPLPVLQNVQKQFSGTPNFTMLMIFVILYLVIYGVILSRKFGTDDL